MEDLNVVKKRIDVAGIENANLYDIIEVLKRDVSMHPRSKEEQIIDRLLDEGKVHLKYFWEGLSLYADEQYSYGWYRFLLPRYYRLRCMILTRNERSIANIIARGYVEYIRYRIEKEEFYSLLNRVRGNLSWGKLF